MAVFPLARCPFPSVTLSEEKRVELRRLAAEGIRATINEYENFTNHQQRHLSHTFWKPIKKRENVTVYKHLTAPSTPSDGLPKLLGVGTILGRLDDVMYGIVTPDAPSIMVKTSYVEDELVDCAVLQTMDRAAPADPYRYLGVKWVVKAQNSGMDAVVRPRDLVLLESTGMHTLSRESGGVRVGVHWMHSIELPECGELKQLGIVRAKTSSCYLYRQLTATVVEVYLVSQNVTGGSAPEKLALQRCTSTLISCWKAVWCAQNKKLEWLRRAAAGAKTRPVSLTRSNSGRRLRRSENTSGSASGSALEEACGGCNKKFRVFQSVMTCELCHHDMCSKCRIARAISHADTQLTVTETNVVVCLTCLKAATQMDALTIARQQLVQSNSNHTNNRNSNSSNSSNSGIINNNNNKSKSSRDTAVHRSSSKTKPSIMLLPETPKKENNAVEDYLGEFHRIRESTLLLNKTERSSDWAASPGNSLSSPEDSQRSFDERTGDPSFDDRSMMKGAAQRQGSEWQRSDRSTLPTSPMSASYSSSASVSSSTSVSVDPRYTMNEDPGQEQLWLQMQSLCLAAEQAYQITQHNASLLRSEEGTNPLLRSRESSTYIEELDV